MADDKGHLFLYEALELRAEYQARLALFKQLLPEKQKSSSRGFMSSEGERREPVADFVPAEIREAIKKLEYKARKLNVTIQQVNFEHRLTVVDSGEMSIAEALDLRKSVNSDLVALQGVLLQAAYRRVIYKEERDIVEQPEARYAEVLRDLEERRLFFRHLNRALRKASFEIVVPFRDED